MSDSYVIIGIHGLANKPDRSTLDTWWRKSILEGLKRNEKRSAGDVSFELVYWADWGYSRFHLVLCNGSLLAWSGLMVRGIRCAGGFGARPSQGVDGEGSRTVIVSNPKPTIKFVRGE